MHKVRHVCLRCGCEFDVDFLESGEPTPPGISRVNVVKCKECRCKEVMRKDQLPQ